MAARSKGKRGRPLTIADIFRSEAQIAPERGGPFRNVRMNLKSAATDTKLRGLLVDELAEFAAQGARFGAGRAKGAVDAKTRHVRALVKKYPTLQAKALRAKADERVLAGMSDGTFTNKVSEARASLGVQKRARKKTAPS